MVGVAINKSGKLGKNISQLMVGYGKILKEAMEKKSPANPIGTSHVLQIINVFYFVTLLELT